MPLNSSWKCISWWDSLGSPALAFVNLNRTFCAETEITLVCLLETQRYVRTKWGKTHPISGSEGAFCLNFHFLRRVQSSARARPPPQLSGVSGASSLGGHSKRKEDSTWVSQVDVTLEPLTPLIRSRGLPKGRQNRGSLNCVQCILSS